MSKAGPDDVGLTLTIRISAILVLFVLWLLVTGSYAWLLSSAADKFPWDDLFKVSVPAAAACIAFYMAWHHRQMSARDRAGTAARHAEILQFQKDQAARHIIRERMCRAFEILRSLDDENRVTLRAVIKKEFGEIEDNLDSINKKVEGDTELDTSVAKVLGSFEDMAIAVRSGYADEVVLYYSVGALAVRYYAMFFLRIKHVREKRPASPPIYCELEYVVQRWKIQESARNPGQKFDDRARPWADLT